MSTETTWTCSTWWGSRETGIRGRRGIRFPVFPVFLRFFLLRFFDYTVQAARQMQIGPVELRPKHLGDVVLGLLRAIHFANAGHQLHGAFAVSSHLLFGGDRSVAWNYGVEVELQRRAQRAGPFHRAAAA